MYALLFILTAFFGAIFIIGPFCVKKGQYKGIIQCSIMLTAFSMWIFWMIVYAAQMNPLMGPRLDQKTIAWMAHAWGNPVK